MLVIEKENFAVKYVGRFIATVMDHYTSVSSYYYKEAVWCTKKGLIHGEICAEIVVRL